MNERLLVFSCPVLADGISRSESEIHSRCEQIESEFRTLTPAIRHLRAGRLTRELRLQGDVLMVDFKLESVGQGNLQFSRRRNAPQIPDHTALLAEAEQLGASLRQTQTQMHIIAADVSQEARFHSSRLDEERALRKLMKRLHGQTLHFDALQPDLAIEVPDLPPPIVSSAVTRINCRILHVGTSGATATSVVPLGSSDGLPPIRRKQHYRLDFPAKADNLSLGVDLLTSAFHRKCFELDIHVCYEPLLKVVTHFLIASPQLGP